MIQNFRMEEGIIYIEQDDMIVPMLPDSIACVSVGGSGDPETQEIGITGFLLKDTSIIFSKPSENISVAELARRLGFTIKKKDHCFSLIPKEGKNEETDKT